MKPISTIFLGSETLFLSKGKLLRCNKIENNMSNITAGQDTNNHSVAPSNVLKVDSNSNTIQTFHSIQGSNKMAFDVRSLDLDRILNSNIIPLKQKLMMLEPIFSSNPRLLYPYNEKIIMICLKAQEKNNSIALHLIENSSNIHLEEFLNLTLMSKAYTEAIYLYFRMGSYEEAFNLCEKQDNLELMIETLKKCPHDLNYFGVLFAKLMNYLTRSSREISEETLIELIERHPNLLECLDIIPVKWMKNPKIVKAIIFMFEKYRFENRTLLKSKQIQIQEIWSQFNLHYSNSNIHRRVDGPEKCQICKKPLFVIEENVRPKNLIQFFSCPHVFHRQCLEGFFKGSKKEIACPLC